MESSILEEKWGVLLKIRFLLFNSSFAIKAIDQDG